MRKRKQQSFQHVRFGDLSRVDAVRMPGAALRENSGFAEEKSLIIHLTVTGRCYARCEGCVNSAITLGCDQPRNTLISAQESDPERDATIILKLAGSHKDQIIAICFYGGEPFLAADKMERTWRFLNALGKDLNFRYMIYTNGELLIETLKTRPEFMDSIWLYSISIDGDESQHNLVRKGTDLSNIKRNLMALKSQHKGHVLQWSTLRENQSLWNCFEEFLRNYRDGLVNQFFWHWAEQKGSFRDFPDFAEKYGLEMERIMSVYVDRLDSGELLPIAHVNELVLFLLTGKKRGHTACGVELHKNFDIVSGKVYACADLPEAEDLGQLDKKGRLRLKKRDLGALITYKDWLGCYECGVHPYCGGRCPVQVLAGSVERSYQYCQLMRLHVGIVLEKMDEIIKGLRKNGISPQEVYDRSAFLARYTDVVP